MDAKSQSAQILAYLKRGKKLTPYQALVKFGCFRLSARIWDLRNNGHRIKMKMIQVGKKHVAQYTLG